MPDMDPRPSGGDHVLDTSPTTNVDHHPSVQDPILALDNLIHHAAHSTTPPSKLLPSYNNSIGRIAEDSAHVESQPAPGSELSTSSKTKRKRGKKKKRVNAFEQRAQAIHAAKHAPDPTTHSPEDSHAPDEAKSPRDDKATAPACSPDFILPAPEKFLNTDAVSSPRGESGREGASLSCKWICTGCGCVNTEKSWGICPICHWPGPEPDTHPVVL